MRNSKVVSLAIVIGALIIAPALYMSGLFSGSSEKDGAAADQGLVMQGNAANTDVDTDMDGLKDWEERLWGSDPAKADSDGDGTNDPAEIISARDPMKAGPDDMVEGVSETPNIPEGSFSKEFAEQYLLLTEGGVPDDASRDLLAQSLLDDVAKSAAALQAKQFDAAALTIIPQATLADYEKYADSIKTLSLNRTTEAPEPEIVIFKRAVEAKAAADYEKLRIIAENHVKLGDDLLQIKVPEDMLKTHIAFINAIYRIGAAVHGMAQAETNPIVGIAALQNYMDASQNLLLVSTSLTTSLREHGVAI